MLLKSLILLIMCEWSNCQICFDQMPGVAMILRGVDITQLDLELNDDFANNGFKRKLFDDSCTDNQVWKNPFNNVVFKISDQIELVNSIPFAITDQIYQLMKSESEVIKMMSSRIEIVGDIKVERLFSFSYAKTKFMQSIIKDHKELTVVDSFISTMQADLRPYWNINLTGSVEKYIDKMLAENFDDDPQSYMQFIHLYGTHYFESAKFGGLFRMIIEIDRHKTHFMSSEEKTYSAMAVFYIKGIKFRPNGFYGKTNFRLNQVFRDTTKTRVKFYGGDADLMNMESWSRWAKSVHDNPWLFAGKLVPIYQLLSGSKRESLKHAVDVYMYLNYNLASQQKWSMYFEKAEERRQQIEQEINSYKKQNAIDKLNRAKKYLKTVENDLKVYDDLLQQFQSLYEDALKRENVTDINMV